MATISRGADVRLVSNHDEKTIERVEFYNNGSRVINMWINGSLSYLSIEEALNIRDEINRAIILATGIKEE